MRLLFASYVYIVGMSVSFQSPSVLRIPVRVNWRGGRVNRKRTSADARLEGGGAALVVKRCCVGPLLHGAREVVQGVVGVDVTNGQYQNVAFDPPVSVLLEPASGTMD